MKVGLVPASGVDVIWKDMRWSCRSALKFNTRWHVVRLGRGGVGSNNNSKIHDLEVGSKQPIAHKTTARMYWTSGTYVNLSCLTTPNYPAL